MATESIECELFVGIQRRQRRYDEIHRRLLHLESVTELELMSTRSQRVIGPRKRDLPPEEDAEVFVVNINQYALEDDIYDFLHKAGTIVQIRLMLTASGIYNRGYCFVKFSKSIEAAKAVALMHQKYMMNFPRNLVAISRSSNNRRLFVSGIPTNKTKVEITNELLMVGFQWLQNVILYASNIYGQNNRGYAFLEFPSHQEAAAMRSKFFEVTLFGRKVYLAWSRPEVDLKPEIIRNVKILYLRPVPIEMNQRTLHYILRNILYQDIVIYRLYKKPTCNYAFVHFESHTQAERAYNRLQFLYINDNVEVKWAMPPDVAKEYKQNTKARSLCNDYGDHDKPSMHMRKGMPDNWSEFVQNQIRTKENEQRDMYEDINDGQASSMSDFSESRICSFNGNTFSGFTNYSENTYEDDDNAWGIEDENVFIC